MRCEGTAAHCAAAVLIGEYYANLLVTPFLLLITALFVHHLVFPKALEHVREWMLAELIRASSRVRGE